MCIFCTCCILSFQAMQHCTVSQVKHLWLVLSHERAKLQAKYGQVSISYISEHAKDCNQTCNHNDQYVGFCVYVPVLLINGFMGPESPEVLNFSKTSTYFLVSDCCLARAFCSSYESQRKSYLK